MNEPLSVNEVISRFAELTGQDVLVRGILHFRFEDVAIYHAPKSERVSEYGSSLWLTAGWGSLRFDEKACKLLDGKIVLIAGELLSPDPVVGAGHMGLWPAELLAHTLQRA